MDSRTVIIMLALYLLSVGGLFALVDRRVERDMGLDSFAICGFLLALACGADLVAEGSGRELNDQVIDASLVAALFMFVDGLRQIVGHDPFPRLRLLAAWLALLGARWLATRLGGENAEEVLLLGVIGAVGLAAAWAMHVETRRKSSTVRPPLRVLVVMLTACSVVVLVRAAHVMRDGVDALSDDRAALVYGMVAGAAAYLFVIVLLWMVLVRMKEQLHELGIRDPLTKLLTPGGLEQELRQHFGRRGASPVSLLLLDLDHFERVERRGRTATESVLSTVAALMETRLRTGDFIARIGPGRFLVGCVSAEQSHGVMLAERLRAGLSTLETGLREAGGHLRCTASVGVSRPAGDYDQWLHAHAEAEEALRVARQEGGNRIASAGLA